MHRIFRENIRRALAESGLTQESLAREIDCANRTVAGWCLGETIPRATHLELLGRVLERDPGWFLTDHSETA